MRHLIGLVFPLLALVAPVHADAVEAGKYEKTGNGIVVHPSTPGSAQVRVEVVAPAIFRVSADPDGDFARSESLMRVGQTGAPAAFEISGQSGHVRVATARAVAEVSLQDGRVAFFDKAGKPILSETAGGRSFTPLQVEGESYLSVRQRFESPADEAIYGFGQHQQGWMNQKGRDVELLQHNIDMAVPFLVSSRNYGLLWDNNSITRLGDPRGLQPLPKSLKLYDADGKPGGLTAVYSVGGVRKLVRQEADIRYQYKSDRLRWPREAAIVTPPGKPTPESGVVWEGEIEALSPGRHTFSLYSGEYAKLWIDGKRVVDSWRQNWNPWHREFALEMKPGERHKVKIDWRSTKDEGYLAFLHRDPLPAAEAGDLSLWSEAGQMIDYYFVAGDSADEVIGGYRQLTGKSVLLPKWAYGFWQSRERYKTQDELTGVLDGYRSRKLPIDNIVEDWSYWPEDAWGSHDFDKARFPDPKGMVDHVHRQHAQIMISIWPKFYPTTGNYKELDAKGHIYRRMVEIGAKDWIGSGYVSTFYDPYSKQARDIYWRQVQEKLDVLGIDAWWMDSDEPDMESNIDIEERKLRSTPTAIGSSTEYFNSFPLLHTLGVYEGDRAASDGKRVFILSRKGYAGTQRNAVAVWSGDVAARWQDLRDQVSAGVNISMSGLANWTFDIGGFAVEGRYETQDPAHLEEWRELNLRWFQFGAFVPLFRSHGQLPYREIWNISPEGTPVYDSMAYYDKLRYTLLPYIYTLAGDTWHRDGIMMRGLAMDFPNDPKVRDIDDQYLFGPAFLVSPVSEFKARQRAVYLPAGADWYDFHSGKRYAGGQTLDAAAPLARMPLFVRAGSIVPTGPVLQYVDEQPDAPLTLVVYTGADARFSLYEDDGKGYGYEKGEFSRIPLAWNEQSGELSIGRREGSFSGMRARREIRVRFVSGPRGDAGALEPAADASLSYDGTALTVKRPARN
ncbi:MAG: TIM-barrel domain-containing protein [Pseudoxanthomonas sp.]